MMVLSLVLITQCIIHKHNELRMQRYALAPYEYYEKMANAEEYAGEEVNEACEELNNAVAEAAEAAETVEL